mgnify:FL=1
MDWKLVALHKHWVTADAVKQFVSSPVPSRTEDTLPPDMLAPAQVFSTFARLSVWYALLYVVVEGYRELKLQDPEVDALLEREECVDTLRRFRNAVFHYQDDPLTEKLLGFLETPESEVWVQQVNRAFERFFRAHLPIDEYLNRMRARGA